jgi:hypothetical protein
MCFHEFGNRDEKKNVLIMGSSPGADDVAMNKINENKEK